MAAQIVAQHLVLGQADNAVKEVSAVVSGDRCLLISKGAWSDPVVVSIVNCDSAEAAVLEAERLCRRNNPDRHPDFHPVDRDPDPVEQAGRRWTLTEAEADRLAATA